MPRSGFLGTNRTLTRPDGRSYTWHSSNGTYLTVSAPATSRLEVARFHQSWGFDKHPYLSITQEEMHIVDMIVLTWVSIAMKIADDYYS